MTSWLARDGTRRIWMVVGAASLVGGLAGCAAERRVCALADECGDGAACLVGVCAPRGSVPLDAPTERLQLAPQSLRWWREGEAEADLPSAVTFGSDAAGSSRLYLEFPRVAVAPERLRRAFLTFSLEEALASSEPVVIEVWRVGPKLDGARGAREAEARLPRARAAFAARGLPARIEVTALVRAELEERSASRLLVLDGSHIKGKNGLRIATGVGSGVAPRLDLYFD